MNFDKILNSLFFMTETRTKITHFNRIFMTYNSCQFIKKTSFSKISSVSFFLDLKEKIPRFILIQFNAYFVINMYIQEILIIYKIFSLYKTRFCQRLSYE